MRGIDSGNTGRAGGEGNAGKLTAKGNTGDIDGRN
jgi:hypothetical protein